MKRMQAAAWSPKARKKRAMNMAMKKAANGSATPPTLDISKLKPLGLFKGRGRGKGKRGAGPEFTTEQVIALLRGLL
jgi:hypothetical protein